MDAATETGQKFKYMLVPTKYVPMEWPRVYELLLPAVERSSGRWTLSALLKALCTGSHNLWMATNESGEVVGALVTTFMRYPCAKMLWVEFFGGRDFDLWWEEGMRLIEQYARDSQCDGIEAGGRLGFWPHLKKLGYSRSSCMHDKLFRG